VSVDFNTLQLGFMHGLVTNFSSIRDQHGSWLMLASSFVLREPLVLVSTVIGPQSNKMKLGIV
jgi:hypothetical protein